MCWEGVEEAMLLSRAYQSQMCSRRRIQATARVVAVQEMGQRHWLGTTMKGRLEVTGQAGPGTEEDFGTRLRGFESWLPHLLLCGFGWVTQLSQSLSFSFSKVGITVKAVERVMCRKCDVNVSHYYVRSYRVEWQDSMSH